MASPLLFMALGACGLEATSADLGWIGGAKDTPTRERRRGARGRAELRTDARPGLRLEDGPAERIRASAARLELPQEEDVATVDAEGEDADGDGLSDERELARGTDPNRADSDGDGLTDFAEVRVHRTDPMLADSDGDRMTDAEELEVTSTNPRKRDSDNDGLSDDEEILRGTLASVADSDRDRLTDSEEELFGTDPMLADTDHDGVNDGDEVAAGTEPTR